MEGSFRNIFGVIRNHSAAFCFWIIEYKMAPGCVIKNKTLSLEDGNNFLRRQVRNSRHEKTYVLA